MASHPPTLCQTEFIINKRIYPVAVPKVS